MDSVKWSERFSPNWYETTVKVVLLFSPMSTGAKQIHHAINSSMDLFVYWGNLPLWDFP